MARPARKGKGKPSNKREQASKPKGPVRKTYDSTLDVTRRPDQEEKDSEAKDLFDIMKKREF